MSEHPIAARWRAIRGDTGARRAALIPYLTAGFPLPILPFTLPLGKDFVYGYANQANLTIEREITGSWKFSLGYQRSRGVHLNHAQDVNSTDPHLLAQNMFNAVASGLTPSQPLAVVVEAGDEDTRLFQLQAGDDLGARKLVGRGGEGDARHARKPLVQHRELDILRPEIVAPLRDTMGFVDHNPSDDEIGLSFDITSHVTVTGKPTDKSMVRLLRYVLENEDHTSPSRSRAIDWVRTTYSQPGNADPEIAQRSLGLRAP